MFGIALTRPSLTMQLRGVDVFTHVCMRAKGGHFKQLLWRYSATWLELFQFLSNVTRFLDCFFWKLPQIRTYNFRKVVRQHTEGMVGSIKWFCWKFTFLFSSERILKIRKKLAKLSPWVWCTTFLGHGAVHILSACFFFVSRTILSCRTQQPNIV